MDLQGDAISQQAMQSMKEYAVKLNIHANHNYDLFGGLIGHITEVLDSDDKTLKIKFIILAEFAEQIKSMLDAGVKLGLSIGGDVTSWKEQETPDGGFYWIIEDIILFEISLTPMPANWDTFNTVTTSKGLVESKCLTGACYELIKNMKNKDHGDNMVFKKYLDLKKTKKEEGSEESGTELTEAKVVDMINEALNAFKEEELETLVEDIKSQVKQEIIDELKNEEGSEEEPAESTENEGSVESEKEKELNVEELKKQLADDVRNDIFKELGFTREPEASDLPDDEEGSEEEGEETQKTYHGIPVVSRNEFAKQMSSSESATGLRGVIQNIMNDGD